MQSKWPKINHRCLIGSEAIYKAETHFSFSTHIPCFKTNLWPGLGSTTTTGGSLPRPFLTVWNAGTKIVSTTSIWLSMQTPRWVLKWSGILTGTDLNEWVIILEQLSENQSRGERSPQRKQWGHITPHARPNNTVSTSGKQKWQKLVVGGASELFATFNM